MIVANGITKKFGSRVLWAGVSFSVDAGEMIAVTGPSGCGKSTLLSCLGLLDDVDSGTIAVAGRELGKLRGGDRRRLRRETLGYLFQNYALIDNANVNFNLDVSTGLKRNRRKMFEDALRRVGLEGRGEEMVYRLSGGEQQRVALARLIVKEPSVILADEPTGALDAENTDMVIDLLRGMANNGCAVVVATHSKHVESNCDSTLSLTTELAAP
ncbi:ATP-binding cassette domain-containing protein [Paractinoplanes rishiriensis]|uniref:ABC transporter ATP-binding protein n=1 Tax=Paractinoplanes rishiriensis TaxID=1050105 RepID=A0A919MXY9_9ACTN|nr:ATP-binding cassette domain-containing protein [Actinoplanes rishiriensis]GIE99503.1 ABC transporter ATP-binding protein [Actinoplanes rishiriensis]